MSPGSDSRPRRISNAFWVSEFIRTKGQKSLFLNKGREATTLSVQGQAATGVQKPHPSARPHSLLLRKAFPHQRGKSGSLEAELWEILSLSKGSFQY